MQETRLMTRRRPVAAVAGGVSVFTAGPLRQATVGIASPPGPSEQVPVKLRRPDFPRFRGNMIPAAALQKSQLCGT